ncbi:MAG: glycosyltransferase family 39 protein [Tepidisphaeraceae bacterium]
MPSAPELSVRRAWCLAVLIAALFFAAVAPTLHWLEFTSGNENIVVQTALEMRHGGPKLLPKLLGEPRVKKPPLVAWLTAAAMRPATIEELDQPKQREAAYHDLAFQARWPALLAAAAMVLATFEFARVWGGPRVGLAAAMVVCTSYLFLKYMRQSTTDAHLAAWVAVANACLLHGLLRGRWWVAGLGGGAAIGVAFMCKGPVALVETAVPAIAVAAVLQNGAYARGGDLNRPPLKCLYLPISVGVTLFLVIALPWFIYVLKSTPGVASTWSSEVSREGATNLEVGNPLTYLLLGPTTAPWIVFAAAGLLLLWQRRRDRSAWVPFIFSVAPLLVMVWFRDRKERYMLPMIMPAAVICGYGIVQWMKSWSTGRTKTDWLLLALHLFVVLTIGLGLCAGGATALKRVDGTPWLPTHLAVWAGVAVVLSVAIVLILTRRVAWAMPGGTFVVMLGVLALFLFGYRESGDGKSPLKPLADAIIDRAPDAVIFDWLPRGRADEQIAIYLNRTILKQDPAMLRPVDRSIALIARQAKQDPEPNYALPWLPVATAKEGATTWYAYVAPKRGRVSHQR